MNPDIYLIDQNYLLTGSTLYENIEFKFLKPGMRQAQKQVRDVIGSGLMNELLTQVNLSAISASNLTLLNEYVRPCLLEYALMHSLMDNHYKYSPNGIQVMRTTHSEPASDAALFKNQDKHRVRAEQLANELRNYLIENSTTFPSFINPGSGYDTVHPKRQTYDTGMSLNWGNNSNTSNRTNYSLNQDREI